MSRSGSREPTGLELLTENPNPIMARDNPPPEQRGEDGRLSRGRRITRTGSANRTLRIALLLLIGLIALLLILLLLSGLGVLRRSAQVATAPTRELLLSEPQAVGGGESFVSARRLMEPCPTVGPIGCRISSVHEWSATRLLPGPPMRCS